MRGERLKLEQAALGELTEDARRELVDELGDDTLRERLEEIRASNEAILEAYPAEAMARSIRVRAAERAWASQMWRTGGGIAMVGALMATGLAMAVLGTDDVVGGVDPGVEITTIKGLEPGLRLFRQGEEVERLEPGAVVHAGDRLQVEYIASESPFGMILSIDGRGAVTLHHPTSVDGDTRLQTGGAVALGRSYELDDAPAFERFFLVLDDEPIDVAAVLDAARVLAASGQADEADLMLPPGLDQVAIDVRKE